jgi:hypothetical protein
MSSSRISRRWAPLLLAGAVTATTVAATPAAAQHVEVFVNGRRVANVVVNGNGALNGNGTLFNGNGTLFNGGGTLFNGNGTLFNGNGTVFDGSDGYFFSGNRRLYDAYGRRYVNGNGTLFNGSDGLFFDGNRRIYNGNGRRYVNGANGRVFVNGANGFNGSGWRNGWHDKRHFGPVDECFPDASLGEWRCTGRRWRTHSGPHRAPYRGARTNNALF